MTIDQEDDFLSEKTLAISPKYHHISLDKEPEKSQPASSFIGGRAQKRNDRSEFVVLLQYGAYILMHISISYVTV